MQKIYVLTHPEASHHVDETVGGWYNSHLTETGQRHAVDMAQQIRRRVPLKSSVQLFSSDLLRTRQTVEPISQLFGIEPIFDAQLREKSYGVAGGKPQWWLEERFIYPPRTGQRLDHDEGIEGGETKRQWIQRVYAAMERIEAVAGEHSIIVTHAGTANWVIAAWLRVPVEACSYVAFRLNSGSITVLEHDDRFHNRTLVSLNERVSQTP